MRMSVRPSTWRSSVRDKPDDFAFDSGPSTGSDSDLGDSAAPDNNW
ncbi:hypothetical protein AB0I34_31175 [Kribbella sp. NPDC050281]